MGACYSECYSYRPRAGVVMHRVLVTRRLTREGVSRMGRGRQKAKHTKIARELKSYSPSVNYSALERELAHPSDDENAYVDKWADQYEDEDEEELEKA